MNPGQRCEPLENGNNTFYKNGTIIGIVDPFLTEPVFQGDVFYMFMLPGEVNEVTHNWTHKVLEPVDDYTDESDECKYCY